MRAVAFRARNGLFFSEPYQYAAALVWPNGAMLHCPHCGRVQFAPVEQVAEFLADGWPLCCQTRMRVGERASN